jgi:type IV pilus assembly protein PilN
MIKFNLLGNKTAIDYRGKYLMVLYALFLVAGAIYMGSSYLSYKRSIGTVEIRIKTLESDLNLIRKDTQAVKSLEAKREQLNKRLGIIAKLRRTRNGVVRLLDDFNMAIPARVWIVDFVESSENITIRGRALGNQDIAQFMKRLEKSDYFLSVDLVESKQVNYSKASGDVSDAQQQGVGSLVVNSAPGATSTGPEQSLTSSGAALDADQLIGIKEFTLKTRVSYQGKLRMSDYKIR